MISSSEQLFLIVLLMSARKTNETGPLKVFKQRPLITNRNQRLV